MRATLPPIERRNVRGQKTRSPGYQPGNHWLTCDRCGCFVRSAAAKKTWDGYVVCPDDWEPRHPQDFVRSRNDRIAPEGYVRSDGDGSIFIQSFCETNSSIIGVAIVGCAIVGNTKRQAFTSEIPTSTF